MAGSRECEFEAGVSGGKDAERPRPSIIGETTVNVKALVRRQRPKDKRLVPRWLGNYGIEYVPCPAWRSLPCLTSSSHTASGN